MLDDRKSRFRIFLVSEGELLKDFVHWSVIRK